MEKLNMQTTNMVDENIKKIGELFPNCLTERLDENGKPEVAIDFDQLRQELSKDIVEGPEERYQFTWPDKRNAIRLANAPTTDTLRPCREDSVDFDNTQNLYIEGDNLEVLKLLRQNYLGKIKMIYIDPPYNTGNDFVYNDDFAQSAGDYVHNSGQEDEEGNRLVANTESNGRFHTDWLNMIYPRLKVAKDLLSEDGLLFISINDKEVHNLKKICSEIFGFSNEVATLIWDKNHSAQAGIYKVYHEYVVVFSRNLNYVSKSAPVEIDVFEAGAMKKVSGRHPSSEFTFPAGTRFDATDGTVIAQSYGDTERVDIVKGRLIAEKGKLKEDVTLRAGFTQMNQMRQYFYGDRNSLVDSNGQKILEFYFNSTGKIKIVKERGVDTPQTTCKFGTQGAASTELAKLFEMEECPFSSPKPVEMLRDFIIRFTNADDIVLDFFSGSSTTAHAVFDVNSRNENECRKFIMVQLPEDLDDALKHSHKDAVRTLQVGIGLLDKLGKPHTICEIGKERIRRAGKKIKEESPLTTQNLDTGFRVLKLDSSNMNDVFYTPEKFTERDLFEDNIKEDRTDEDLLFQTMIELGIELSAKIEKSSIAGKTIWSVNDGYLMACFDKDVNETTIKEIANLQPFYFVMRDNSMATDNVADNFEQIWSEYSNETVRRIL
jgi:adenine-specific DNA-methyltransferase